MHGQQSHSWQFRSARLYSKCSEGTKEERGESGDQGGEVAGGIVGWGRIYSSIENAAEKL